MNSRTVVARNLSQVSLKNTWLSGSNKINLDQTSLLAHPVNRFLPEQNGLPLGLLLIVARRCGRRTPHNYPLVSATLDFKRSLTASLGASKLVSSCLYRVGITQGEALESGLIVNQFKVFHVPKIQTRDFNANNNI